MNYANSYFWTGKSFAAQYFTAVPFGLNFQGFNGWYYDGGGAQLWREVYDRFNLVPIPCGNTGVQMTGWFRKEIKTVDDLKGLKMRIPGLAGRVYKELGVDSRLIAPRRNLPLARARRDRRGRVRRPLPRPPARPAEGREVLLHHRLARDGDRVSELIINKAKWDKLPPDLQGDRRECLRRLQRHQRGLVPEEQRRGDGRPGQEPGRDRAAAARRRREGAARRDRPRFSPKRSPRIR